MRSGKLESVIGPRIAPQAMAEGRLRFFVPSLFLGCAALLLLVSVFLPYWRLSLATPNLPDGLEVKAYLTHLEGDLAQLARFDANIGVRPLDDSARLERSLSVVMVVVIALLAIAATVVHNRFAAFLSLPAILFPAIFLADLYAWLHDGGEGVTEAQGFIPPLLGEGGVEHLRTFASVGPGLVLSIASALLVLVGLYFHRRVYKPLIAAAIR